MTLSTETQRILEMVANRVRQCVNQPSGEFLPLRFANLLELDAREAARSASGAEFSELHTTRVHVAPAPPQPVSATGLVGGLDLTPSRHHLDCTPPVVPTPPQGKPHSWMEVALGWECRHCKTCISIESKTIPVYGCERPGTTTGESGLREPTAEEIATIIYECMEGRRDLSAQERGDNPAILAARKIIASLYPRSTPRAREGDDKLKMLERIAQAASFVISAHTMIHPHMSREEAERQSMNTLSAALGPWQATQCASTATQADGGTK